MFTIVVKIRNFNNEMKKLIAFCLFWVLVLTACSETPKTVYFLDQKLTVEQKLELLLDPIYLDSLQIDSSAQRLLTAYYAKRNFRPRWASENGLTNEGKLLQNLLKNPIAFGLPGKRYQLNEWDSVYFLKNELLISSILASMPSDLKNGFFDLDRKQFKPKTYCHLEELDTLYDFPTDREEIVSKIIAWGTSDTNYLKLANALFRFASVYPLEDETLSIPTQREDSTSSVENARKALISKGYLHADSSSFTVFTESLKQFQRENGQTPDGIIGKSTAVALEESNLHKCRRVALAMEKWRWKNGFKSPSIWVNIPEFKLRYFVNDSLKSENKVIVGKFTNQTPEFSANLRAIVSFPYWNVPYSISSTEMLPEAKKNPAYFTRNKLKLLRKGQEIDPFSVNWSKIKDKTFPYSVRQDPGAHNSLGIIKFEFHNPFGVYIHDTPNKNLFNTTVRAYSHGCVRCETPIDLAKMILFYDENMQLPDSLDTLIQHQIHRTIPLKKTIPIQFDYITVGTTKNGNLHFYKDIYQKDDAFLQLMFE